MFDLLKTTLLYSDHMEIDVHLLHTVRDAVYAHVQIAEVGTVRRNWIRLP